MCNQIPLGSVSYLNLALKMCLSLVTIHWPQVEGSSSFQNFNRWQYFTGIILGEMHPSLVAILQE